jgi:hypothetical protein
VHAGDALAHNLAARRNTHTRRQGNKQTQQTVAGARDKRSDMYWGC